MRPVLKCDGSPQEKKTLVALVVGYIVITSVIMAVAGLQLFVSATDRCPCFTGFYCYAPGDCSGSTGFIGGTSPRYRVAG